MRPRVGPFPFAHPGVGLRASVPPRERSRQVPAALHTDRPGSQHLTPLDQAQVPLGEHLGILDRDDEVLFEARLMPAKSALGALLVPLFRQFQS